MHISVLPGFDGSAAGHHGTLFSYRGGMLFLRNLRLGLRLLRRNPSFAASAIAVIALGIGATTAVFSVVKGVLLTPLPYREPGRSYCSESACLDTSIRLR